MPNRLRSTIEKFRDWITLKILKEPTTQPIYWTLSSVYLFRAIYTCTELKIADLLYFKPMRIDQLSTKTKTDAKSLDRLMRALTSFDIFKLSQDGYYENTPLSLQLLNSNENPISNWVLFSGNSENWNAYANSTKCIKTGVSAFETTHKISFYDFMEKNRSYGEQFRSGMNAWSHWQSTQIINAYDFSRFRRIVDIGGGRGALLTKILTTYPNTHGELFDSQQAIELATASINTLKLNDRCSLQSGDFFSDLPTNGDAYILKHVLRDWSDAECLAILKRCRKAMAKNGRLILIEGVIDSAKNHSRLQKLIDLEQLFWLGGKMRTLTEWKTLLNRCDFSVSSITGTTIADVTIIEAYPS